MMLRFELKKILGSRLNQVAIVLGLALVAVVIIVQYTTMSVYDPVSGEYIPGAASFALSREQAAQEADYLTEEVVTEYLRTVRAYPESLDSDNAYADVIRNNSQLYYMLLNGYNDLSDGNIDMNILKEIDFTNGAQYYESRMNKIRDYLNMDFSFGNYSDAEKTFWLNRAESVSQPFAYGSKQAMEFVSNVMGCGFYLLAVVIVCVSAICSRDVENGAAMLLFTTRYGKTRLVRAKLLAGMLFSTGYLALGIFGGGAVAVLLSGGVQTLREASLPVQLWNNAIPYDWSIGKVAVVNGLLLILIGAMLTAMMLLISALWKSSMATMAAALLVVIGPAFLPFSKTCGWYNDLIRLAPVRFANIREVMGSFSSYVFGSVVLDLIAMGVIVFILLTLLFLLPLRRVYVERVVKK